MMEKKQVSICGFKQNCYRVATSGGLVGVAKSPNTTIKKYTSLEKVALPNGFIQELVEKDYPINAESVTSLADGADYRNDPSQAVANAPQRVNLGDVTEAQKYMQNPLHYARLYKDIAVKLEELAKASTPATQETKQTEGDVTNG